MTKDTKDDWAESKKSIDVDFLYPEEGQIFTKKMKEPLPEEYLIVIPERMHECVSEKIGDSVIYKKRAMKYQLVISEGFKPRYFYKEVVFI